MRRALIAAAVCALTLVGCGGTATTTHHLSTAKLHTMAAPSQCVPAPGQGHMGVCATQPGNPALRATSPVLITAPHGLLYDLYEGNYANCSAPLAQAKGILAGVIIKAYEYRPDHCFARYWHELAALHIWHAAYVFAHSCWQAQAFVSTIKAAGGWDAFAGPNIVDAEVADAFGSVACLSPQIRSLSHVATVVGYTAPGTWPGGGNGGDPLWVADYGLNFGCVWTCHPVAWQYTDGSFGPFPHSVGPFHGDLSVNYGLGQILAHPTPPAPLTPKQAYQIGFQRGFTVAWLKRRHLTVPPFTSHVPAALQGSFNAGFQSGFKAGWKA